VEFGEFTSHSIVTNETTTTGTTSEATLTISFTNSNQRHTSSTKEKIAMFSQAFHL
jgi:hypothetical protein